MFIPELASLEFQECQTLPANTLVGPISVIREIRCALGPGALNLRIGDSEAVIVSSDLYHAFYAWQAELEDEQDDDSQGDSSWLN